jgi:hypothetical protein
MILTFPDSGFFAKDKDGIWKWFVMLSLWDMLCLVHFGWIE